MHYLYIMSASEILVGIVCLPKSLSHPLLPTILFMHVYSYLMNIVNHHPCQEVQANIIYVTIRNPHMQSSTDASAQALTHVSTQICMHADMPM